MLEAEKVATIHHVIPVLCSLEHHLSTFTGLPATTLTQCLVALKTRFGFITEDAHLLTATVLSPHGVKWLALAANNKYLVFPNEIQLLNIVCDDIEEIVKEISDIETSETASLTPTLLGFSDSVFGYGTLGVGVQFGAASIRRSVEEHISNTQLLSTDVDPLALWKARPLSKFTIAAVQVLGVLASSAQLKECSQDLVLFALLTGHT